jgi:hypothetical protein
MSPALLADPGVRVPERDYDQRMDALARANRVRKWRAGMKVEVKSGRCTLVELLDSPPELLETMKIVDLLLVAPKIGRVKAGKMLARVGVSPSKAVGALSDRQRRELLAFLRM